MTRDCFVCRKHAGEVPPPGGPLYEDDLVYASHVFDREGTGQPSYLGQCVLEPKRHVAGLPELTDEEAAALGSLSARIARALVEAVGAEHVYSAVIGHNVPHLHVHVFPRYPHTPREYWFLRVDEWEGSPKGGADEIAAVTSRIRASLH